MPSLALKFLPLVYDISAQMSKIFWLRVESQRVGNPGCRFHDMRNRNGSRATFHARFFAGVPLYAPNGFQIGALYAFDCRQCFMSTIKLPATA